MDLCALYILTYVSNYQKNWSSNTIQCEKNCTELSLKKYWIQHEKIEKIASYLCFRILQPCGHQWCKNGKQVLKVEMALFSYFHAFYFRSANLSSLNSTVLVLNQFSISFILLKSHNVKVEPGAEETILEYLLFLPQ